MARRVTVWSDYTCPFCLVGRDRVERLREDFPEVEVEWRAFELHPNLPPEGVAVEKVLSPMQLQALRQRTERVAGDAAEAAPRVVANTHKAHLAADLAREEGRFPAFHDAAFQAYWHQGRNIGDAEVLGDVWASVGGDRERLAAFLADPGNDREFTDAAMEAGVMGAPTFDLHGPGRPRRVVGAQPYEDLRRAASEAFGEETQ